ncbi:MAG: glycoside hydrolase 43 family protein [Treponema sp.]|nr:glycoside hydrolase 43 family protein [Treponema sp.]
MPKRKSSSPYIIPADFPDLDVIRVDDTYYMVSTTMHFMPGCVILRSYNLVDWEHAAYVYDQLEATPAETLQDNKGAYGKGMWAASLRYHQGKFYVSFVANDTHKTYLFTADKIEGPWKRSEIQGFYHDMSLLFDDDGKVYCVSGNTDIQLTELEEDLSAPKKGSLNKVIIRDDKEKVALGYEGSHIYKINGKYYIFFIHWPKDKMRTQACFVSDKIDGPYTGKDVLSADVAGWNSGAAQGGIVSDCDGNWYGILFQDHGALGRIPVLVPVHFENDFPVFGEDGKVPLEITVNDYKPNYTYKSLFSNDFTNPAWQWNHIPDLSLIERDSHSLHIKSGKTCINLVQAANTLTQRVFSEQCSASVKLDATGLKDGDFAGLAALEGEYGFVALTKKNGKYKIITASHKLDYSPWATGVFDDKTADIDYEEDLQPDEKGIITLREVFKLGKGEQTVDFFCLNKDKTDFRKIGKSVGLRFTLDHFTGVRIALFYFSTEKASGSAIFKDFKIDLL